MTRKEVADLYYQKNKEHILEERRKKYAENPELYKTRCKTYTEKNKERILEKARTKYSTLKRISEINNQ